MEICPGQHWAAPNVPSTKTLLQSVWVRTLSLLISDVSLVTLQALGDAKNFPDQDTTSPLPWLQLHLLVPRLLSLQRTCHWLHGRRQLLTKWGRFVESAWASDEWWMLPIISKCCSEYFDMLEMSHGNSLFCIIKSPFQTEKITNIRIAIFSFQAAACWVLVTTQRSL